MRSDGTDGPNENANAGNPVFGAGGPHEALYYDKSGGGKTVCALCPRRCALTPGETGLCLARRNVGGSLCSLNYGAISSLALDPIEKKPLRRFHPGATILSDGSFGCNFTCPFCQNHSISRGAPVTRYLPPDALVREALSARSTGNIGIAYTYNEPLVSYEYVRDAAGLARSRGLCNVLVTNGYIEQMPLRELIPYVDAMNIDLKGDETFYIGMCGGDRQTVLNTIEAAYAAGLHIEITNLLVSGRNDNAEAVTETARCVASVSESIPLHLSRFFPGYKMSELPPTDAAFVREAAAIARKYLKYVYTGNV